MNRLLIILYEVCLWILACIALPKMIYHLLVYKKYRKSLLTRLGIKYPSINKTEAPLIWIHAVSVGETKAVATLARELKRYIYGCQLVISSTTETGHAEAKRSLPFADYHVYMPLDFSWIVRKVIAKARPQLVILCESDMWYNFLRLSKYYGASLILVNGKISERSMKRFSQVPFFATQLFKLFDVLCVQNQMYKERFIKAGAPEERLVVTGNLKLDEEYPRLTTEEIKEWRHRLGISPNDLILTIGSTHSPEEQLFIPILKGIWKKMPNLKVILVPRHPERFKEVASLLQKEQISSINFSEIHWRTGQEHILLIDAMGMLRMCYQLADVALVGGSYTIKVGGHNILEPCWYEKPVLFGPHMHTQLELVDLIKQYGAGCQVRLEQLQSTLENYLQNPMYRTEMGQKGLCLVTDLKGSTQRTLQTLSSLLDKETGLGYNKEEEKEKSHENDKYQL